ncbi:MAG: DUF5663 domain-containing protein [Candidatus Berkelbacteria bacterium]
MPTADDKLKELDVRNIKAAAILQNFSLEEMEQVLETNIFELMGVESELTQEQKDDLLKVFKDTIENRTVARLLDALPDEDVEEFSKLAEESAEKADQFLADKGINKEQIAIVEIVLYKLELAKSKQGEGVE